MSGRTTQFTTRPAVDDAQALFADSTAQRGEGRRLLLTVFGALQVLFVFNRILSRISVTASAFLAT